MSDKNYLSFNGDDAGNIWLNGEKIFDAAEPGTRVYTIEGDVAPPDLSYSDTLKFSRVQRLTVRVIGVVYGGKEDCVDMNNKCRDVAVMALGFHAQGKYVWTVKGACQRCAIAGPLLVHGNVTDVEVGNHSDQSDDITGPVRIDLVSDLPVRYNLLNGYGLEHGPGKYERGIVLPGFFRSLFAKGYALLKKILRIVDKV